MKLTMQGYKNNFLHLRTASGWPKAFPQKSGDAAFNAVTKYVALFILQVFVWMLADTKGFAPAGATKGLSDRPLETFGPHMLWNACKFGNLKLHFSCGSMKKLWGGVGGAVVPPTFIRIRRLCRRGGSFILLAKSITYTIGRPLVGRRCLLEKVVKSTFSTR